MPDRPGFQDLPLEQLIRQFFCDYPDYAFCSTLAENVKAGVTTYANALALLGRKQEAARDNRLEIEEKLNARFVMSGGQSRPIKDLSLQEAMDLEDENLREVLEFYFKHPYAHGRTRRTRLLPRPVRAFFLSSLVGHAYRRHIQLDYAAYFAMLRLL